MRCVRKDKQYSIGRLHVAQNKAFWEVFFFFYHSHAPGMHEGAANKAGGLEELQGC